MRTKLYTIAFEMNRLKHIEQIKDTNILNAIKQVEKKYTKGTNFRLIPNITTKTIHFEYIPMEGLYTDYSKNKSY